MLDQPRGLRTLFLTEMWERFTYYGMRSILILFLVGKTGAGGLALDDHTASAIYGLYIAGTYVLAVPGGWIADRLIGAQRAVLVGGALILIGNALLAFGAAADFFLGLLVIVVGVGLLKPNISAMVGALYPQSGGSRREAGFTIFYMGISVGALLGSILMPLCAARFGWRSGFALGVVGMALGLAQFLATRGWLGGAGRSPAVPVRGLLWGWPLLVLLGLGALAVLIHRGHLVLDATLLAQLASWLIGAFALGFFAYLLIFAGLAPEERRRIAVVLALFIAYAAFYAGFEQGGASMNLFAERYTDRNVAGWVVPAGLLQGTTALVTILFAPLFAALWMWLGRRGRDPVPPAKFAAGLALLGAGFLVMFVAARLVVTGAKVSPGWLLGAYLLQEWGDLCLSPIGLSSMTKLAPSRFVGQVMGVWFLALALGNNLAGQLSGLYDARHLESLPALYLGIAGYALAVAVLMLLLTPLLKRWMSGVT